MKRAKAGFLVLLISTIVITIFVLAGCSFGSIDLQQTGWELTQYSCDSGGVAMFYSLRDLENGKLILIDSGNPENADKVRSVIDEYGGHVDAWILTHYHNDHIGAFNEVYDGYKDRIDQIYITPMDQEMYVETAKEWDRPDVFMAFLEKTEGVDNVTELHRGDEFELFGLLVQVFNAFDDIVVEKSTDIHNDCSLVFKISTDQLSMLFMGDLSRKGIELGQYILETYGAENVRADFIQAGHHGNWGQPIAFYEQLMPKEIFMDAPEHIFTDEKYDAKDLEAWCKENGIVTHDFRQTPCRIILD